jgi:hypothetical protein
MRAGVDSSSDDRFTRSIGVGRPASCSDSNVGRNRNAAQPDVVETPPSTR